MVLDTVVVVVVVVVVEKWCNLVAGRPASSKDSDSTAGVGTASDE
jgi:hypothetical protein